MKTEPDNSLVAATIHWPTVLPAPGAAPAYGLWAFSALVKVSIFILAGRAYGYLADELYFLDAAEHLALGYLDFPPAIAWVCAALSGLLGSDLLVLRGFACLIGILVTWLAIDISRLLGGRQFAQWTVALVVLFAPAFLSVQSMLTMNVLDQLCWAASFWLLIRYLQTRAVLYMLLLGVTFGVALLTKLAVAAWFIGLAIAVLIYARWLLKRTEVWLAALIMVLIVSPFLAWQHANGWPFIEFIGSYNAQAAEAMVIDQPIFGIIATMNPPFLLIWLPGLVFGLIARDPVIRLLGTAAVISLTLFLSAGVKFYFATPLFILFTAFGALLWERWLAERHRLRDGFLIGIAFSGLFAIPISAPVLPPSVLQQVADFIRDGEQGVTGTEPAPLGRYFPHFAEMHGWPELVNAVSNQYESLDASEQSTVTVVAAYFGQAGALNQLDHGQRLPAVYSGHMNYHYWSEGVEFRSLLAIGFEAEMLEQLFEEVEILEVFQCQRCMARENGLLIARASKPRLSTEVIRHEIKRFYFF